MVAGFGVPELPGSSSEGSPQTQLPNMFFIFINLLLFSCFPGHSCISYLMGWLPAPWSLTVTKGGLAAKEYLLEKKILFILLSFL